MVREDRNVVDETVAETRTQPIQPQAQKASSESSVAENGKALKKPKNMTLSTINPLLLNFKAMEYAARGPVIMRAMQLEREMAQGKAMPFKAIFKANLGDAQAMGQRPITFLRQVLACVSQPELINQPNTFPDDVKQRAVQILDACRGRSAGAYTDSRGLEIIRKHVAEYITRRDGGVPSSSDDIILFAGASDGIRACLKLLKQSDEDAVEGANVKDDDEDDARNNNTPNRSRGGRGGKSGVLIPIPQYPLYSATLSEYGMLQVGYYLEHTQEGWTINIEELRRATREARGHGAAAAEIKAIVIINPGNPTGNVLSRKNLENIIRFAYEENLVIFADEVYQDNVYKGSEFISMKKVLMEMGSPFNSVELFSFYSCSKGYICECGFRGAYVEAVNLDPSVKDILVCSIAAKLCPTILGQAAVECAVNPPRPGDESYKTFTEEKTAILSTLEANSNLIVDALRVLPGIKCGPVQGAMYVYPEIKLPKKFIQSAEGQNLEPDVLYALQLLETTGICVVPGSGVGQRSGTFHFRTTVLVPKESLGEMLDKFSSFHISLMEEYS